jgi:hypothetical protein
VLPRQPLPVDQNAQIGGNRGEALTLAALRGAIVAAAFFDL